MIKLARERANLTLLLNQRLQNAAFVALAYNSPRVSRASFIDLAGQIYDAVRTQLEEQTRAEELRLTCPNCGGDLSAPTESDPDLCHRSLEAQADPGLSSDPDRSVLGRAERK